MWLPFAHFHGTFAGLAVLNRSLRIRLGEHDFCGTDVLLDVRALVELALEALALASEKVQRALDGAEIRKVIVVPDRIVNIVAG